VSVTPGFFSPIGVPVIRGRDLSTEDGAAAPRVAVINESLARALFGDQDPLGEVIRVKSEPCRVVGVLEVKGQSATGQDQDDNLLMPYTTVMKKIKGQTWLDDILMSAVSASLIDQAEQDITALLRQRHHIQPGTPDDFNLRHPTEIAEAVKASTQTMETLLAAIASVSLLVGGVGIMNIMLVSVTERTREIGLRMAVGARARDVLRQFLVEAVLLSVIGGMIGVAIGTFAADTIANEFHWPTRISTNAVGIAFFFSAAIGICFGYYPAFRAARLDPIDALRIE
jgi:putative ABC transport system permease protein